MILRCTAFLLALMLLLLIEPAKAQNEGTLHFMSSLPQVVYNNPAFVPKHRFSIGLPGSSVLASYANNGFSYNSAISKSDSGAYADLTKLANNLSDRNYITNAVQVDLFRLSFKTGARFYWTYTLKSKIYNRIMLPKGILALATNGTSFFINNEISISPKVETLLYLESAWGTSYQANKDLSLGLNVKWLKGVANITTKEAALNVELNDDFNINANASLDVQSSGVYSATQSGFDPENDYKNYLKNNGFAFDVGATYRLFDRLTLGVSLIDVGFIKWKNDVYGYQLDKDGSSYSFKGLNIDSLIDGNFNSIESEIDTLKARFTPSETRIGSYNSPLPAKAYFSANFEIRRNFTAGVVFYAEKMRERFSPSMTVGVNKHFGKHFSAAASYTISNKSYNNLGAGFSLNFSPFQFYLVGDNLLGAPIALATEKVVNPYINGLKYFNIRTGLNIVWGWNHTQEKQAHPKRKRRTN